MFLSDPMTAETLYTALTCAGAITMGLLALSMLPWTDAEIEEVDQSARRMLIQLRERLASVTIETTGSGPSRMTSISR